MLAAIRSGQLAPGMRLRETKLAEWLSMSRTPVRQAIHRLETEGLLTTTPRRGLLVTQVDAEFVAELYLMRGLLEGTAARLAAESASPSDLRLLSDMAQAELDGAEPTAESNRKLHSLVYRSAKNRFLLKSLNALNDSLALLGRSTLADRARAQQAAREHAAVIEAIVARDPDSAEALMRRHIRCAY